MPIIKPSYEEYRLYGGKVVLKYDQKKHSYMRGTKKVSSVTQVSGLLPKDWMPWYIKKYARLSFMQALNTKTVVRSDDELVQLLNKALSASDKYGAQARMTGTHVHKMVANYLDWEIQPLPTTHDEQQCISAFWQFMAQNKVEPLLIEKKVYWKPTKEDIPVAGTVDLAAIVNGIVSVLDWKTSQKLYQTTFIQPSIYADALNEELKANPSLLPSPIKQIILVRLGKDGTLDFMAKDNWDEERKTFRALQQVDNYLATHKH